MVMEQLFLRLLTVVYFLSLLLAGYFCAKEPPVVFGSILGIVLYTYVSIPPDRQTGVTTRRTIVIGAGLSLLVYGLRTFFS